MTDVAIIGGGAAGLCTAIMIKKMDSNISVTLFELADRVGKKLATTGNGRCNISNVHLRAENYHGDRDFAWNIISGFNYLKQKEFFSEIGILFREEDGGKAYPLSLQATSVVDALRFCATEMGVEIKVSTKVDDVIKKQEFYTLISNGAHEEFKTVVVACGGMAGGKLGSDFGLKILKNFGHKIENTFPAIVQLKTEPNIVRQLKGIKVDANVTAISDSGTRTEFGEVLFCDYGLSGPPILQVSRLAEGGNMKVQLDICPNMTEQDIESEIIRRKDLFYHRPIGELLLGFINKRLGQVIIKTQGIDLNMPCGSIKVNDIKKLTKTLKRFQFDIVGTTGFQNAQVMAGGAQPAQFFSNCMSKKSKGLFAVGEVLNVDGDCGGYNLAFAWSSSFAAARGVSEYIKEQGR